MSDEFTSKAFCIPTPTLPTGQERRERSAEWLSKIGCLLIDKWPQKLLDESMPTIFLEFPLVLAKQWWDSHEQGWSKESISFANKIDKACGWDRKFYRLNSRSPKDASDNLVSCSGKEILHVMRSSERMLSDFTMFEYADATPMLCLRENWHLRPSQELRVFIKNGRIKAVAEYGHSRTWVGKPEHDIYWRGEIEIYVNDVLGSHLPLDTIVVDVAFRHGELKLIELNPYGLSDPVGAKSYELIEEGIAGIARCDDKYQRIKQ